MKLFELLNAQNAFDLNHKFDDDMQLILKVVKFIKEGETEAAFYKNQYSEILNKYAIKNNEGSIDDKDGIKIAPDLINAFNKEVEDLNNVEVEKPNYTFTIEELQKCGLTGLKVYALYPFINE